MKKICILVMATVFLYGFSYSNDGDIKSRNAKNVERLTIGMTRQEVTDIMGTGTGTYRLRVYFEGYVAGYKTVKVTNPERTEKRKLGDDTVEVVYYFTNSIGLLVGFWDESYREGKVAYEGLTPIVFKDNRLAGLGWGFVKETWKPVETLDEEYYWIYYWGNGGH